MTHLDADGYVLVKRGDRRRAIQRRLLEHVAVAEAALGRKLPAEAIVHHVDENKANNDPSNLVICPDRAYHNLIHRRMRALAATGNANYRKCVRCLKYDSPENLSVGGQQAYHAACNAAHTLRMKARAQ